MRKKCSYFGGVGSETGQFPACSNTIRENRLPVQARGCTCAVASNRPWVATTGVYREERRISFVVMLRIVLLGGGWSKKGNEGVERVLQHDRRRGSNG